MTPDWEEAFELCNDILELIPEVPEAGEDFAASVEDKVMGIQRTIEERKIVTEKQLDALENMKAGVARWTGL